MSTSEYNKIVTTVNSVTSDYTFIPDQDNVICIDTSFNRLGINTLTPEHSIDISGGTIQTKNLRITSSGSVFVDNTQGFTGTGAYTNFTIKNGIITNAT